MRPHAAIVLVLASLALVACGSPDASTPEAAIESYFNAVEDGNGEDACSLGTDEFRREAVITVVGTPSEGETCEQAVDNVPDVARDVVKTIEVTPVESNDRRAVVDVTFDAGGPPVPPIPFALVREADAWAIEGVVEETLDVPDAVEDKKGKGDGSN